jgi:protein-lysine N-methyltransferase EEF2KMT
VKEVKIKIFEQ